MKRAMASHIIVNHLKPRIGINPNGSKRLTSDCLQEKWIFFADIMIVYTENPKEYTKRKKKKSYR